MGTKYILCDDQQFGSSKLTLRNRKDLKVIKTIHNKYGLLYCGLNYPEEKIIILGISWNLVRFNYKEMRITEKVNTKDVDVLQIVKVNETTFLIGGFGNISLRNRNDLTLLTILHIYDPDYFY